MKKQITIAMAVFALTFSANSQETKETLVSKKGTPILPQKGDFGIGIDATPFLTYVGNIFGKTASNDAPNFTSNGDLMSITGKYFINDNTAYRAAIRIGITSTKDESRVRDDEAFSMDGSSNEKVSDIQKYSGTEIFLGLGIEKRRGYGRLQGVYGLMGELGYSTNKTKIEHGNQITRTNRYPTRTYNFNESKSGSTFGIGASGFVGIEYFIAPKISLGGEFAYRMFYSNTGDGSYNRDIWDSNTSSIRNITTETGGDSEFTLDNSTTSSISLHFYF